jgi:hypothetical protein
MAIVPTDEDCAMRILRELYVPRDNVLSTVY